MLAMFAVALMGAVATVSASAPAGTSNNATGTTQPAAATKDNMKVRRADVGKPGRFLLAEVKGKDLWEDAFTTYSTLVDMLEGPSMSEKRQHKLLQDLVMQQVIGDVLPEYAKAAEPADIPLPYKTLQELYVLKHALGDTIERETSPTREELEQWTRDNAARFTQPEQVHAFHLFMQTSPDSPTSAPEQVRKRMEKVRQMAEAGTSFALLARQYSEAASSRVGGDIGWLSRRMPIGPEAKPMNIMLENALFELKPGQVSDILQTSYGLHLLYCADRTTTYTPTTDELITSRILPRTAQFQMARRKWVEGIKAMREKYGAKVLYDLSKKDNLSSGVEAVSIKGQTWTLRQLEELYGQRFTSAFRVRAQSTETLSMLFNEVLDDLTACHWALERGIDKDPNVARDIKWAGERMRMKNALTRYIADKYPVTDELVRKTYETRKETMRLPEATGYIISINAKPTTVGMSRDEARALAKKKAQEIRQKILAGADIEKLAREVSQDNRASSGGLVERSVLAHLNDPAGRMFAAVATWLQPGEVSEVRQFGDTFVVVKLVQGWPGEIPPFEQVRVRLEQDLRNEAEQSARKDVLLKAREQGLVRWANPAAAYQINPDRGY